MNQSISWWNPKILSTEISSQMASSQTTNCLDFSALLNSIMMMHSMYSQGLQFYFLFQFCRKQNIFFHVCPFALTLVVKKIHFFLMLLMTHIGQSNFSLHFFLTALNINTHDWHATQLSTFNNWFLFAVLSGSAILGISPQKGLII